MYPALPLAGSDIKEGRGEVRWEGFRLFMKILNKTITGILILVFIFSYSPVASGEDAAGSLFQPCQYKQVYRYYIEKAEAHLADDQPEAALQAYKMALMVQPISEEAKQKIRAIEKALQQKRSQKEKQVDETIEGLQARRSALKGTLDQLETKRRYVREPVERRPVEIERSPAVETTYSRPSEELPIRKEPVKREPIRRMAERRPDERSMQTISGPRYREYLDPIAFNNGINESIQNGAKSINTGIAPGKISGEYRMAVGATSEDAIWKDANADHVGVPGEMNWRYLFGENQYNMYDKKIYDRFQVEAEGPITSHLSGYSEIVIDPWTFAGRKEITVTGSGGSSVNMTLKYWSNARRTLNETYRAENGDIVNLAENKIIDGYTTPETYRGLYDWGSNGFTVPKAEIDDMYVPIRKLWIDYNNGPYSVRLFPMANQDQALTSDDPMRLSNNKVWWEESPWLDSYDPSKIFNRTDNPVKQGQWIRSLSFVAKDSDYERLTFLRGASVSANYDNGLSIESTIAAPRNLWDFYEEVSSVPGAIRIKFPVKEDVKLGALYTVKAGLAKQDIEALNQVVGVDGEYLLSPDLSAYGETAFSFSETDEANGFTRDFWGAGYTLGLKGKGDLKSFANSYEFNTSFAHMNDNFNPGLSNYRFTRRDTIYGKHIYFQDLKPENEEIKIGDGVDIDRIAANVNLKVNFLNDDLKTRVDFRDVRTDSGDFIEDVGRVEAEYKVMPKVTVKSLARYEYLPKTTKGIDPLVNAKTSYIAFTDYFSDKDVFLENNIIEEGKDPSIGTYSFGLKYDMRDNLSLQGIYELTNDPLDMPRGLLNNVYVTQETRDGILWDKIVPFLYSQDSFGKPPYDYYSIYKAMLTYYPIPKLKLQPSYVFNQNKFATTLDDNVNHAGFSAEYKPNERLSLGMAYYFIQTRDLWMDTIGGANNTIVDHHNVFLAAAYSLNPNQDITIMFGEYAGYGRQYYEEYTSIGPLDTQHIVRLVYKGRF